MVILLLLIQCQQHLYFKHLFLLPYREPAALNPIWLVGVKGEELVVVLDGFFRQETEVRVGATRSCYDTAMYTHLRKLRIRISI